MQSDKSTMYIDVTQLAHWPGRLTGIPRVMFELATRSRRTNPNTVFVVWEKHLLSYCEIDLEQTLASRGRGITYLRKSEITPELRQNFKTTPVAPQPKPKLKRAAAKGG